MLKHIIVDLVGEVSALGSVITYGIIALMFFALGFNAVFTQLIIALIFGYTLTSLLRSVFFKQRPNKKKYTNFIEKIDASSFPSLHAMRSAFLGVILISFFQNFLATALIVLCIAAVGTSRVMEKRHYAADVIAGVILGIIIGLLAVRFF